MVIFSILLHSCLNTYSLTFPVVDKIFLLSENEIRGSLKLVENKLWYFPRIYNKRFKNDFIFRQQEIDLSRMGN